MAYTYAYTRPGAGSTVLRSDGLEFPQDPGNSAYQDWRAFVDGGGSTAAAPTPTLEDVVAAAKVTVNQGAADARHVYTGASIPEDLGNALRFREAQDLIAAGGSPDPDDYPLLAAEIPSHGANVTAVATAVAAELATLKGHLAAIESYRLGVYDDLDAAADAAAVQAILDGLSWP